MSRGAALLLVLSLATPPAAAQEVDTSEDRYLGPARQVALMGFPLDALLTATVGAPRFEAEVRVDLGYGFALGIRPIGVWILANDRQGHGGGGGGALALQWYTRRPLSGPFIALQGGDIEVVVDGQRGRMAGASAIFGYMVNWDYGAVLSIGLGLGYWHRFGVLDTGLQWPEILSIRLGSGWGWGYGDHKDYRVVRPDPLVP